MLDSEKCVNGNSRIELAFNDVPVSFSSFEFRDDGYVYYTDKLGSAIEKCVIIGVVHTDQGKIRFNLQRLQ